MAEEKKLNGFLIILSILIPIVGYVLYFLKNKEDSYGAKVYLSCAIAGSVIGILLML